MEMHVPELPSLHYFWVLHHVPRTVFLHDCASLLYTFLFMEKGIPSWISESYLHFLRRRDVSQNVIWQFPWILRILQNVLRKVLNSPHTEDTAF